MAEGAAIIPVGKAHTGARTWRALALLATLASAALLAVVLAYWGWRFFGPARVHIPPATPSDPLAVLLASGLLSADSAPVAPGAIDSAPQVLGSDVRLLGVFAEANGRGYALFKLPSGPKLVAVGQEITPGAMLKSVQSDAIGIGEGGRERTIPLRAAAVKTSASPPAANKATAAPASAPAVKSACAAPANFKGQVVALNAELLSGLMTQPESWQALVEPVNGALTVRDDSGFATMLGLKRGDRIEQANGIALAAPADVVGVVLRPLVANQPVRLTGSRDGQPRELWLRNASC